MHGVASHVANLSCLFTAVGGALAGDGPTQVFQFRQVNVDAGGANIIGDAANEPSLAVDPTAPNRMVIGFRQFDTIQSEFRQAGWAYSHDGGRTWTFPGVIQPPVYGSDPVLAADADGHFYYASLTRDYPSRRNYRVNMFRSDDAGVSWGPPVYAYGGDKPWMSIDRTGGIGRGNVYLRWNDGLFSCCGSDNFTRSTDAAHTFMTPIRIALSVYSGMSSVSPDGTLYVCGRQGAMFTVARSTNARDPGIPRPWFDLATRVNLRGTMWGLTFNVGEPNSGGLMGQANIAVDHSDGPTRGNIHLLCSVKLHDGSDPLDVMIARSTDDAVTWSDPVRVNDDPPGNGAWQWFGTLSVAPNGRIDVVWNDTRDSPDPDISRLY